MPKPTLLIPIVFPDPESYPLTDVNLEGLSGFDVVLFGYWEVSDDVSPDDAREAYETEAEAVLYETAAHLSHAGASTDIRLHFGPPGAEQNELQEQIAEETGADGVLVPKRLSTINNILVPLRDNRKLDEIVEFVSTFDTESIFALELYHAVPDEGAVEDAKRMLEAVERTLLDRGISESDLEITVEVSEDAAAAIADRARNHNIVVMGETEDSDAKDRTLGHVYQHITETTDMPIVVIRE